MTSWRQDEASGLRFLVVRSPSGAAWREGELHGSPLLVGRHDPSGGAESPDLAFDADPAVSRQHARLEQRDRRWFIEDLGTTFGTLLGGRDIQGAGPVEVAPGSPVRTGRTIWTIWPGDWLFARWRSLVVLGPCRADFSYAFHHCGIASVGPLTVVNLGGQASPAVTLRLTLEGFSDEPTWLRVAPLAPGERSVLEVNPALSLDRLRHQTEPVTASLRLQVEESSELLVRREMRVLGLWDWPVERQARHVLAAFVSPRHPRVEQIVSETRDRLERLTGIASYRQLLASGRAGAERRIFEALYQHLFEAYQVHYLHPDSRPPCQTIRSGHRMFPEGRERFAQGTCLDWALFLAGCLENVGLYPLIIVLNDARELPRHALCGCWSGPLPGTRAILADAEALRADLRAERLLALECTGLAQDAGSRLDFAAASAEATRQIAAARALWALDVAAARPPLGAVTPMEFPYQPEVGRADDAARAFARAKRHDKVEMTCLLLGLLAARGAVLSGLLETIGRDSASLEKRLLEAVGSGSSDREPAPTRNYQECFWLAGQIARHQGIHSVREQDLLWALFIKAPESPSLQRAFQVLRLDVATLQAGLTRAHPLPVAALGVSSLGFTPPA